MEIMVGSIMMALGRAEDDGPPTVALPEGVLVDGLNKTVTR